jgi:hypothetical protein
VAAGLKDRREVGYSQHERSGLKGGEAAHAATCDCQ